ncbi:MAG TPA: hypothetical protein VGG11_13715 [Xanthobacteraceae bacterium]|jgi:hypothetical protein
MQQDDTKFDGQPNPFTSEGAAAIVGAAALAHHGIHPYAPSVARTTPCVPCNGTGYVLAPNGPDDVDKEPCSNCEGKGHVLVANF